MNITKEQIDTLNTIVTIEVAKEDYSGKVDKVLSDYRKNASIPGFRKGMVPISHIKKQYGNAVLFDEVNKLVQKNLFDYLNDQKIDFLGDVLPKEAKEFDWNASTLKFEFELGLKPQFEVNIDTKGSVTKYAVTANEKMIDDEIAHIQKQFGNRVEKEIVEEHSHVSGVFKNDEKAIEHATTFQLDDIKGQTQIKAFLGKKVGDVISLKTKGFFKDDHQLIKHLKISHDDAHHLDITVTFTIENTWVIEKATLNEELLNKLYGENVISTEEALRIRLKEDLEKQFEEEAKRKMTFDTLSFLIDQTEITLPSEFLKKWIQMREEKSLSKEEADKIYHESEKGFKAELITTKIITEHNAHITHEDLKEHVRNLIKAQMRAEDISEDWVNLVMKQIEANETESKRINQEILNKKIGTLFLEKANATIKKVDYDTFIKEAYKS